MQGLMEVPGDQENYACEELGGRSTTLSTLSAESGLWTSASSNSRLQSNLLLPSPDELWMSNNGKDFLNSQA